MQSPDFDWNVLSVAILSSTVLGLADVFLKSQTTNLVLVSEKLWTAL